MEEAVSAAKARRKFSHLLHGACEGRSYVVTSRGRPVARIVPADAIANVDTAARASLLARLEQQAVADAGRSSRDELYKDAAGFGCALTRGQGNVRKI